MGVTFDTAPAFSAPSVPPIIEIPPVPGRRPAVSQVKLRSGVTLPLPIVIWNTRALVLDGLANTQALDAALSRWVGRHVETVPINGSLQPEGGSSQSLVSIWAPDYVGCTIGPIKVVCLACWTKPLGLFRFTWWHYYGNSPTNHEFKASVWGLKNELAAVELSYDGPWKSARVLQDGRAALTMAWDTSRLQDAEEGPANGFEPSRFLSISQRKHDSGENEVWLRLRRLRNAQGHVFPFDAHRDVLRIDPKTTIGRALGEVSFVPVGWEYMPSYSGFVWITQPNGRGSAPPWPDGPSSPTAKSSRGERRAVKRSPAKRSKAKR
jgi:hypothetical protein